YNSPTLCPSTFVNNELQSLLEDSPKNQDCTILVGDLNIYILAEDNDYTKDYLNILAENAFLSTINDITRPHNQTGTCIDHIFLNSKDELNFVLPFIIKTDITDHFTIAMQLVFPKRRNNPLATQIQYKTYIDMDKLKQAVSEINWESLYQLQNTELAAQYFVDNLKREIERYVLSKIKHIKTFLQPKQLKIIYNALVESHLTYGIIAWRAANKTCLNDIAVLQRRIFNEYPSNELYKELNILDIKQLFYYKVAVKIYAKKHTRLQLQHQYGTRSKETVIVVPKMNTARGQQSYEYLDPKIYNSIPELTNGLTLIRYERSKL
ncbi:hypothetical protein NQ318_012543, partial [Aromia moschata]